MVIVFFFQSGYFFLCWYFFFLPIILRRRPDASNKSRMPKFLSTFVCFSQLSFTIRIIYNILYSWYYIVVWFLVIVVALSAVIVIITELHYTKISLENRTDDIGVRATISEVYIYNNNVCMSYRHRYGPIDASYAKRFSNIRCDHGHRIYFISIAV